jgi:transcription initiation factor TFIID TATA-box-binding protein
MKICNTLFGLKTQRSIDLHKLHQDHITTTKYNPTKFPGLSFKILEPKATILVFKSGNLVCTGTKTIEDAYDSLRKEDIRHLELSYKLD